MTDEKRQFDFSFLEPFRRYVPLAAWAIVILLLLFIPLKVISYGYLPGDDALRHAAKAVSGKPWPEILVLGPAFHFDPNWGWHWLLGQVHLCENWDAGALVVFSVVMLFLVGNGAVVACLKRPEAWLAAFILVAQPQVSDFTQRFLLGPSVCVEHCGDGGDFAGLAAARFVAAQMVDGPVDDAVDCRGGFFARRLVFVGAADCGVSSSRNNSAGAFCWRRAGFWGRSWVRRSPAIRLKASCRRSNWRCAPSACTRRKSRSSRNCSRPAATSSAILLLGGVIVLRQLAKLNAPPLVRHPAFWLVALGWVLGCETFRFWEDWGLPALAVLMAGDLQLFFESRFAADSFQRLALVCGLALTMYAVTTNDFNSRWTNHLAWRYLTPDEPEIAGWLPDKGGIFYTVDQSLFYQTFFKNPNADWRYMLGFESTLMPDEDFKVYQNVLWNFGDAKAYKPWVDKMRPEDRLVIRGGSASPPPIPQLEWNHGVGDIWIGRLPRPVLPGTAPPTVPATAPREGSAK